MIARLRRLWPRNLAGQMIFLLLAALAAAQALSFAVFLEERDDAVRNADHAQALSRISSVVRLLADTPPHLSTRIAEAASGPRLNLRISGSSAVPETGLDSRSAALAGHLAALLGGDGGDDIRISISDGHNWLERRFKALRERWRQSGIEFPHRHDFDDHWDDDDISLTIAVRLDEDRWLNGQTLLPVSSFAWNWATPFTIIGLAAAISIIVIHSIRRITGPMRDLAAAADRFGRGQARSQLEESGPEDIRNTIRAFNEMRDRLERFVRDRTQMLAAISHDLRTPITTLRLRAEFVPDAETRENILATLDEMHQMTEAVLRFAREDAASEPARQVDLVSLLQSTCDDLADTGLQVEFAGPSSLTLACRPTAIKRAFTNVVQNAVSYGERARVCLRKRDASVQVIVDDDGPGISDDNLDKVFEPFFRVEGSRNQETGGVGLGLAIARSIVRSHGGDIGLENRKTGLRVTLDFPVS